ncbi:MAG TPA: hypothetical protein VKE69_00650 [Planctomycetota bacterium]|nr:hypothetical protein [Planctomycetota bacterium]
MSAPSSLFRRIAALAVLSLAACSSSWQSVRRSDGFMPSEIAPVRVAVLRFDDRTGGTSVFLYPFLPFIWLADVVTLQVPEGTPDALRGADVLRALLIARVRGSHLNIVDPLTVDTTLEHLGLYEKASSMDPKELGKLLGVDAVLTGELLDWSGNYYVVESRTIVEARVVLRSCTDGSELFRGEIGVSDSSGVSGGPTGYVSAAATPLAALAKGPYRDLAILWADRMGASLVGDTGAFGDGAMTEAPPAIAVAAATKAPPGGFRSGDVIDVYAVGTPGGVAWFDLGTLRVRIPMSEFARVPRTGGAGSELSGHYRGTYVVASGDRVENAPLAVTLVSPSGRARILAESGPVTIVGGGDVAATDTSRRD